MNLQTFRREQTLPIPAERYENVRAGIIEYFDDRGFPVEAASTGPVKVTADTHAFLTFRFEGNRVVVVSETDKEVKTKGLLERGIEIVKKFSE